MFVVVTSLKGGAGKTTLALHVAGALATSTRGRVLCIDADARNRSALGWVARGQGLPFDVVDERAAARSGMAAKAAHIVIDSQAAPAPDELRASVEGADVVLVPVIPDGIGLDAAVRTLDVLGERRNVALVLSQCPPAPARAAQEAREALADVDGAHVLRTTITRRAAFRDAGTTGRLVFNLAGPGAAAAAAEISALTQELKRWRSR